MILLETNVLSELLKPRRDAAVVAYVARHSPDQLFTAAICEAELHYGIARLPDGRRRNELTAKVRELMDRALSGQVLRFDRACAVQYGDLRARRERAGRPISVEDALIAATACAYGMTVATRDVEGFAGSGVDVVDPWTVT